jgi:peptide/nickel transport system ATP-binding protein
LLVGPEPIRRRVKMSPETILEVRGLSKEFPVRAGLFQRQIGTVKAVQDVSFELGRGETLGIVGESGCGKTTLARCMIRLIEPTTGIILLNIDGKKTNLRLQRGRNLRDCRRHVQMVFQDPVASLNPRIPVREIVGEPLIVNKVRTGKKIKKRDGFRRSVRKFIPNRISGIKNWLSRGRKLSDRVGELLELVGLNAVDMHRFPHAFSGGQRQRIGIARALALSPELIIADEPVSALDVSVRAQILNLLAELKGRLGLSLIFIGHDLSIISHICDRVAVMYLGRIVEIGDTASVFNQPRHPYTEALLSAAPIPDPERQRRRKRVILSGEPPSPMHPPSGCPFHPRCGYKIAACEEKLPDLRNLGQGTRAACIRAEEIKLRGAGDEG